MRRQEETKPRHLQLLSPGEKRRINSPDSFVLVTLCKRLIHHGPEEPRDAANSVFL